MSYTTTNSSPLSLSSPPVSAKEQLRGAKVETTAGWRAISRGDRDAGLTQGYQRIVHTRYHCQLCGICIGPGYYETEMYLWPVHQRRVYLAKKNCYVTYSGWLQICGGCACHRSRMLPSWMKILSPQCWETTLLLAGSQEEDLHEVNTCDPFQMAQIVHAIEVHLRTVPRAMLIFLMALLFFENPDHILLQLRFLLTFLQEDHEERKEKRKSLLGEEGEQARQEEHHLLPPIPSEVATMTDPLLALGAFFDSLAGEQTSFA